MGDISDIEIRKLKYTQWCFISNVMPNFNSSKMQYLVFGLEHCFDTNQSFYQGFVCFKNRHYVNGVKKAFPNSQIKRAEGSVQENIDFCKKEGEWKEFGIVPTTNNGGNRFAQVLKAAEKGELKTVKNSYPGLYIRYKKTLESLSPCNKSSLNSPCGIWIYGPPHSGKKCGVMNFCSSLFLKSSNKWWDGYRDEENVLISDINSYCAKFMAPLLKIWTDKFPFYAQYKGSSKFIRPKQIFVTSHYKMEDLFSGADLVALQHRFDLHYYNSETGEIDYTPRKVSSINTKFELSIRKASEMNRHETCPSQSATKEEVFMDDS